MTTEPAENQPNRRVETRIEDFNPAARRRKSNTPAEIIFKTIIQKIEFFGLICITVATLFASYSMMEEIFYKHTVTLGDLLLMFLYLEVLAMVAIYLESGKLPIRMPMYIAIVALARYMILEMKELSEWQMIAIAATITLITFATLLLRYGNSKYPYNQHRRATDKHDQ